MAIISPYSIITQNGDYELLTKAGHQHLLTLRNNFGGGTVTLTGFNNATGNFTSIAGASWTAEADARVYATSNQVRITLTGSTSPSIAVNFLPLKTL